MKKINYETLTHAFSQELGEISKNTFSTEDLGTTALMHPRSFNS